EKRGNSSSKSFTPLMAYYFLAFFHFIFPVTLRRCHQANGVLTNRLNEMSVCIRYNTKRNMFRRSIGMQKNPAKLHNHSQLMADYRNQKGNIMDFFDYRPFEDYEKRVADLTNREFDRKG